MKYGDYLSKINDLEKKLKGTNEFIMTPEPLGVMPTFIQILPIKCSDCKNDFEGSITLMYGRPNTLTCQCGHMMKSRWVRVEGYTGPEIIKTTDKPLKEKFRVRDLK
jgi:hypothetical protein